MAGRIEETLKGAVHLALSMCGTQGCIESGTNDVCSFFGKEMPQKCLISSLHMHTKEKHLILKKIDKKTLKQTRQEKSQKSDHKLIN